jgi:hypothetical protein
MNDDDDDAEEVFEEWYLFLYLNENDDVEQLWLHHDHHHSRDHYLNNSQMWKILKLISCWMIEKQCSLTSLYMITFSLSFFFRMMKWQKCGHSLILLLIFVDENEVVISTSLMLKRSKTRPRVNWLAIKRKKKKHRFDMIIVFRHAWFICLQNECALKLDWLIVQTDGALIFQ